MAEKTVFFFRHNACTFILLTTLFAFATVKSQEMQEVNPSQKIENIQLLPHQQFPIDYLLRTPDVKGLLINHYMGTGKTYLGIGFAEQANVDSVIILAPRFIESHWLEHLRNFPVKNLNKYQFVSYNDAPEKLEGKNLSRTVVILDEVHNLIKLIKSPNPIANHRYSELYQTLRGSYKILALSGTPIYNDEYDLAYLINLVSGQNLLPFNEEQFRLEYTQINQTRSFWRGYTAESQLLTIGLPYVAVLLTIPLFFVGPAIAAFSVLGVGSLLAVTTFPISRNLIAPLDHFSLRELKTEKFIPFSSKYVSFYEIENQNRSEFPSMNMHDMQVPYNAEQFWFYLNFTEKSLNIEGLARIYKDVDANLDPTYLTLNSSLLQSRMNNMVGAGREIGNFEFKDQNTIVEPPKFSQVLAKIKAQGFPRTVIYSNYYENGTAAFAEFLNRRGYQDSYAVLKPDMPPQQFADIVQNYNNGKFKILLLHPEVTEGISLKGTRQFHILEPMINLTVLNQVIARAVRYQSHTYLPEAERHVDIYAWKAVIESKSWNTIKLKKANWFKRYSELSDWSNWGEGISQVNKNYDRQKSSPDTQVSIKLISVNKNMETLKKLMKENSIEKHAK
jgi:Helicase conserved C-terminal domain